MLPLITDHFWIMSHFIVIYNSLIKYRLSKVYICHSGFNVAGSKSMISPTGSQILLSYCYSLTVTLLQPHHDNNIRQGARVTVRQRGHVKQLLSQRCNVLVGGNSPSLYSKIKAITLLWKYTALIRHSMIPLRGLRVARRRSRLFYSPTWQRPKVVKPPLLATLASQVAEDIFFVNTLRCNFSY